MSGLLQRFITAIFFVAVMLGGLLGGVIPFLILFGLINVLSLWELYGLLFSKTEDKNVTTRKVLGSIIGIIPFVAMGLYYSTGTILGFSIVQISLLFLGAVFSLFLYELFSAAEKPFTFLGHIILGFVYVSVPYTLLLMIAFKGEQFSTTLILGMILMTWANDTGAYLLGSQIGKTPLFKRISPKKTWEGSISGVVVTFIVGYLLSLLFPTIALQEWLILAGIVAIFGSLGDLVESMLKRSLHIKDSGNILPGHGGVLDRFDAFMFLIPFSAIYLLQ